MICEINFHGSLQTGLVGYKVLYSGASKIFPMLEMVESDGTCIRETAWIVKMNLLIIDDFRMQPLDSHNRASLIEIIENRHGEPPTIITASYPLVNGTM
jgi:DNA replication protein DnaC